MSVNLVVTLSCDLIALEANASSKNQFLKVSSTVSADDIVSTACGKWQVKAKDHTKYCLIFDDTKKYLTDGKYINVTISNTILGFILTIS